MARKHFSTEQIIGMLREAEVRLSQGQTITHAAIPMKFVMPAAPVVVQPGGATLA
jgi:hypothetical protein